MTIVFQSYRRNNVPPWISRCLASVESWAKEKGFTYRFIDDELFEYAPAWYRQKVNNNVQLVSDLARLLVGKELLQEGYQRAIWIDADALVFDPDNFAIESSSALTFCREVWIDADRQGNIVHQQKINNSISVFNSDSPFLNFYIDACRKVVEESEKVTPVLVGTSFLTALRKIYPFPLLQNVGIISPALVHDILTQNNDFIAKYLEWHGHPIYAANLCGSKQNEVFQGIEINESAMEAVVQTLLAQKGLAVKESM